jgi:hypothetical protein
LKVIFAFWRPFTLRRRCRALPHGGIRHPLPAYFSDIVNDFHSFHMFFLAKRRYFINKTRYLWKEMLPSGCGMGMENLWTMSENAYAKAFRRLRGSMEANG